MEISEKTKLGLLFLVIACLIGVITSVLANSVVKPIEKMEETAGVVLKSARPIADVNGDVLGVLIRGPGDS